MYYSDAMDQDVYADVPQSQTQTQSETQQATQSTQGTQSTDVDPNLWGFLVPCKSSNKRIDLVKTMPAVHIGRSKTENDFTFENMKISNKHCILRWDGKEDSSSTVTVEDLSSNGTFINRNRIGKGRYAFLREGNEIAFGAWAPHQGGEDFRYIFRFTASGPPQQGIYTLYDVGHELGSGSFATVRQAVHRPTGKMYAVKIVHRSKFRASGAMSKDMFMREVSILERLNHKNICTLKETFQDDQSIYLVLELIDGGDLLDYIIAKGGLGEDESQLFTAQLCEALAYIHNKGIAHRDLKPENVLLTKDNPPVIKVADFGLAKAVDSMTKFKTTCGTPCYLAPEVVLRGPDQNYDHLVDSWSVGVIVYSMLTNASPFIEQETDQIKQRFRTRYIDWTPFYDAGVSNEAYDFVLRLLQENPRKRMSSNDALVHPWISPYVSDPDVQSQSQSQPTPQPLHRLESGHHQFVDAVPLGPFGEVDESMLAHPGMIPGLGLVTGQVAGAGEGLGRENSDTTPMPTPGVAPIRAGMSHEFEHIRMDDMPENGAPGPSQSQPVRQPLISRVAALAQRDPDGQMQSFELVHPADAEASTVGVDAAQSNGKRKASGDVHEDEDEVMNGASSPVTPADADEDGDEDSGSSPVNAARTSGRSGRGAKKSRAATDGVRKNRAAGRGGAAGNTNQQGGTPRIRTRAAARAAGAGDVDM